MSTERHPLHAAVLDQPGHAAGLVELLPGVRISRVLVWRKGVEFEASFAPMIQQIREGFVDEHARVLVPWAGIPLSFPRNPHRRWKHRNPPPSQLSPSDAPTGNSLCLWYPRDPRPLAWVWADGFTAYFDRLHRHLLMEEHWRRTGTWPAEDAQHGHPRTGAEGAAWPVTSNEMKEVVAQWNGSQTG